MRPLVTGDSRDFDADGPRGSKRKTMDTDIENRQQVIVAGSLSEASVSHQFLAHDLGDWSTRPNVLCVL